MELQPIYERLSAGDTAARNELIEAAMPLAETLARRLAERMRAKSHVDDILGDAYSAVVEIVDSLRGKTLDGRVGSYLARGIIKALRESIGNTPMMGPAYHGKRRVKAASNDKCAYCGEPESAEIHEIHYRTTAENHRFQPRPSEIPIEEGPLDFFADALGVEADFNMGWLIDLLVECCETEQEAKVICLRGKDYSNKEIAAELKIAESTTSSVISRVRERFCQKLAV
jgi:RNA polymerase sigma factor (sigma-70 family)